MSDIKHQLGGSVCRTSKYEVMTYWPTLGDAGDFRQSSKIGQFVAQNERGLEKKKPPAIAKAILEEFPQLAEVIVNPRHTYGEAAWLRS